MSIEVGSVEPTHRRAPSSVQGTSTSAGTSSIQEQILNIHKTIKYT